MPRTVSFLLRALLPALLVSAAAHSARAQDCDCTAWQARAGTVAPLNRTVGEATTVRTAPEFREAINQANARGGHCTILVADGTYRVASTASFPYITASNVMIRSLSGRRDAVILEGGGMRDVAPDTEDGLLIGGDSVTVADLTIRNVGNHGIQVSGHHLFVHNVRILDTYQQMLKGATDRSSIDSGIVECSMFAFSSGIAANFYTGGLDIHKGRSWIVRDNYFVGIQSPSGSVAEHAVHFWNDCASNIVERNVILNCDRGIGFGLGGSANSAGLICNNMIYNSGAGAFSDVGIGLESSPDTRVYNNTVLVTYMHAIEYRFAATAKVAIANNLTNRPIAARDGATGTLLSNVTTASEAWFADPGAGDLHLASAVPGVVDTGAFLAPYVIDDIDHVRRDSRFDIGADEFAPAASVDATPRSHAITVFPNPGAGLFVVQTQGSAIDVYDAFGRAVCSVRPAAALARIDLRPQASGVYLLLVRNGDAVVARSLLHKR
jgi:hypothetical protein